MSPKTLIYIGMVVGSYAGSFIPLIWGASMLSFSSIVFGMFGGIAGIWLGFQISKSI